MPRLWPCPRHGPILSKIQENKKYWTLPRHVQYVSRRVRRMFVLDMCPTRIREVRGSVRASLGLEYCAQNKYGFGRGGLKPKQYAAIALSTKETCALVKFLYCEFGLKRHINADYSQSMLSLSL